MTKAQVGSISSRTLRTPDLLEAFGWELQHLDGATAAHLALAEEARARAHYFTWNDLPEGEEVEETENDELLVEELFDALQELAPAYCSFGASEGDGANFGFWPSIDAIEELPRVSDPSEVPAGGTGEDVAFINDHGNITVYGAEGHIILELV